MPARLKAPSISFSRLQTEFVQNEECLGLEHGKVSSEPERQVAISLLVDRTSESVSVLAPSSSLLVDIDFKSSVIPGR
jgi:hypothetical protein